MIKKLIETAVVGILGARIILAALTGVTHVAAGVLSARILYIVFVGMSPMLVMGLAAAKEEEGSTGFRVGRDRSLHSGSRWPS